MGYTIASERVRSGLTQAALSEEIGVSVASIKSWEAGRRKPNADALVKMADLFGCSADYLLGRSNERLPK